MSTNVFLRGKYKGKTFVEVGRIDYEYLVMCLGVDVEVGVKEEIYKVMKELDLESELKF